MTLYEKHLPEPWFSLIKVKVKVMEARLNKNDFANMQVGDTIVFTNNDLGFHRKIKLKITNIRIYDTFKQFLLSESLHKCLPGISTIEEGVNVYYRYCTQSDEQQYKIKAFSFDIIEDEPAVST